MLISKYSYIQTNQRIIKSINPSELRRWAIIGTWSSGVVSSIWHTRDGIEIALKESSDNEIYSLPFQLAFISYLYWALPEVQRRILPKFLGVLADKKWQALWIIMDRFWNQLDIDSYWPWDTETREFQETLWRLWMPGAERDEICLSLFKTESGLRLWDLLVLVTKSIRMSWGRTAEQDKVYNLSHTLKDSPELYTLYSDQIG